MLSQRAAKSYMAPYLITTSANVPIYFYANVINCTVSNFASRQS